MSGGLTGLGLRHSRVTIMAMLLTLAIGAISYLGFPKREDLEITIRTAVAVARNPGLTLTQLEDLVARPMEEAARAIPGVDEVRTKLAGGTATVQVDLATAVPEADLTRVFDEIADDLGALARTMPDGTQGPIVNAGSADVSIATIAVTGAGFALPDIETAAEGLRDRLYGVDGVSAVTVHGDQDEVITLTLDRARLASIGATLDPVLAALQGQNLRLPAGSVVFGEVRVPLETTGDLATVEEIESLLVELPDAGLVRLGDVVEVRRGPESPADVPVFQDGQPAILLGVEVGGGVDVTKVGPVLQSVVADWQATKP